MNQALERDVVADGPNADGVRYWNSPATAPWTKLHEQIDAIFAPLTRVLLDYAAPVLGERVVDVGCGCGRTVLDLCWRVGPRGHVLGLDVAESMVERARERLVEASFAQGAVALADASTHAFEPGEADLVFSRFGVMFFRNPVDAFANLRGALKSSGRLAFAAWRPLADNPWFLVPLRAAKGLVPDLPRPGLDDPGPFAFGDPDRVRRILSAAGWRDMKLVRHDPPMRLADPGNAAGAARFSTRIGPVARALQDAPSELRARVEERAAAALTEYDGPDGVTLPGSLWLISARP